MKEYTVTIGGLEHTLLLSDEDAKARGAVEAKAAATPKNKAVASSKSKG